MKKKVPSIASNTFYKNLKKLTYCLLFLAPILSFAQADDSIIPFLQFNGNYDFTAIGNTLNPAPNPCNILTESSAELTLDPSQSIVSAHMYWAGSGSIDFGAQYPADDGSPNSTNDEKGNAAANAALAANDADTPQLVTEKPKGKVSKSSKLPSISKVKSMCNEGLSTSQIQQLHPKCNKEELTIMIKNTKKLDFDVRSFLLKKNLIIHKNFLKIKR